MNAENEVAEDTTNAPAQAPPVSGRRRVFKTLLPFILIGALAWGARACYLVWEDMFTLGSFAPLKRIGFEFDTETPEYGQVTLTNIGETPARNIRLALVEDYTHVSEGKIKKVYTIDRMEPGESRVYELLYVSPKKQLNIKRIDVWIKCDRGRAHGWGGWSWWDEVAGM